MSLELKIRIVSALLFGMVLVTVSQAGLFAYRGIGVVEESQVGQAVGVSMTIPENKISKQAEALKQKELELDAREAEIERMETIQSRVALGNRVEASSTTTIYVSAIGTLLLLLVLLNFYFDFKRREEIVTQSQTL